MPNILITFGEALEAMKEGKKVKRRHWGGYWFIPKTVSTYDVHDESYVYMNPMIVACLKDGGYAPAQAYQEDLLAEDWHLVKEEQKPFSGGITAGTISAGQIITGIAATPYTAATVEHFKNGSNQYADLKNRVEELRKIVEVQGENGNWNYDHYHHGMYNGLVLALATMENYEPAFKDAPEEWLAGIGLPPEGNKKSVECYPTPAHDESIYMLTEVLRALSVDGTDHDLRGAIKAKIAKVLNL